MFDAGLDRVDAHLGRYKTLGDPGYETLAAALTTIGTNPVTLHIPAGTVSVSSSTVIPANVALNFHKGGILQVADTLTLTVNGVLTAGPYQIFSLTGSGSVTFGSGAVAQVYAEWFGAKGDGATDD